VAKHLIRLKGVGPVVGGKSWESSGRLRVGRSPDLEIGIADSSLSRRHAEVLFTDYQGWSVRDLGSTNGTFLNGIRVGQVERKAEERDVLQFGNLVLVVASVEGEAPGPEENSAGPWEAQATTQHSWEEVFEMLALDITRQTQPGEQLLTLLRAGHHLYAVLLALGLALWGWRRQLAQMQATESLSRFLDGKQAIQCLLVDRAADPQQFEYGLTECRWLLDSYHVLDDAGWQDAPKMRDLPPEDRARLREEIGALLILYVHALGQQAQQPEGRPDHDEQLERALGANGRAQSCYNPDDVPRALLIQRAQLSGLLGRADEARSLREKAVRTPLRTAQDRILLAAQKAAGGHHREAIPLLHQALEQSPQDYWAWFLLGSCHNGLSQSTEAATS
jgi:tetratricopeptide (TPR) repeat protein